MIKLDELTKKIAIKALMKPRIFRTKEERISIYLYQNKNYIKNKKEDIKINN